MIILAVRFSIKTLDNPNFDLRIGAEILTEYCGKNGSEAFDDVGHSKRYKNQRENALLIYIQSC